MLLIVNITKKLRSFCWKKIISKVGEIINCKNKEIDYEAIDRN